MILFGLEVITVAAASITAYNYFKTGGLKSLESRVTALENRLTPDVKTEVSKLQADAKTEVAKIETTLAADIKKL